MHTHLLTRGRASLVTHGQLAVHVGPVRQIAVDHQALRRGLLVSGADLVAHPGGAGRARAALLDQDNLLLVIVLWVWPLGHPAVLHQHMDVPVCQHTHCTSATAYGCPRLSTHTLYVSNSIRMFPSVSTDTACQQYHIPIGQHTTRRQQQHLSKGHCTSGHGCSPLSTLHCTSTWMSNVGFKTIIIILSKSIHGKFYSQIRRHRQEDKGVKLMEKSMALQHIPVWPDHEKKTAHTGMA